MPARIIQFNWKRPQRSGFKLTLILQRLHRSPNYAVRERLENKRDTFLEYLSNRYFNNNSDGSRILSHESKSGEQVFR